MIVVASLILLLPSSAQAYLDPGSGSMLLYFLIGVFATLIYSIKNTLFAVSMPFKATESLISLAWIVGLEKPKKATTLIR